MSNFILSEAWRLTDITPTQKLVLISLADQANDDGLCWPSVKTIGIRTCLQERSIRQAIADLEKLGLLRRQIQLGKATYYTLTPSRKCTSALDAPLHDVHPPLQDVPVTPAPGAYITIKNPKETSNIYPDKSEKQNRRTRLPDNFVLTDKLRDSAVAYWKTKNRFDISPGDQWMRFITHHRSKGSRMADWECAWQTWYVNAVEYTRVGSTPQFNLKEVR